MTSDLQKGIDGLGKVFFLEKRWFQGKGRDIAGISLYDSALFREKYHLVLVKIVYRDKGEEIYFIPAVIEKGEIRDVSDDSDYLNSISTAFDVQEVFQGSFGEIIFRRVNSPENYDVDPINAGSSNCLYHFHKSEILKTYRKLSAGDNVEFSMNKYLAEGEGFRDFPLLNSYALYREKDGREYPLMIVQRYVPNTGSAWDEALVHVGAYLKEEEDIEIYSTRVENLGRAVAGMHFSLSRSTDDRDFSPETIVARDMKKLSSYLVSSAERVLKHASSLRGDVPEIENILSRKDEIFSAYRGLSSMAGKSGKRIRIHGDFHLGQVLTRNDDRVCIIDFEGEPLKSAEERLQKHSPLKDVAGMLRSFHYAAYSGYFAVNEARLEKRAISWYEAICRAFLDSYRSECEKLGVLSLPQNETNFRRLLSVLKLEKAIYELEYEMGNRPDWIDIPVRGIETCLNELRS